MRVSLEYLFTPAEKTNLRKDVLNIYDAYPAHSVVLIVRCMVESSNDLCALFHNK
jgi:hypothetical protein